MRCGYCGEPLKKNAQYCTYCGHKINGTGIIDDKRKDGSYIASLISLAVIVFVSAVGCMRIILPTLQNRNASSIAIVSKSDSAMESVTAKKTTSTVLATVTQASRTTTAETTSTTAQTESKKNETTLTMAQTADESTTAVKSTLSTTAGSTTVTVSAASSKADANASESTVKKTTTTAKATIKTSAAKPVGSAVIDKALIGKWSCTDKTALGYSAKDFGVKAEMTVTFGDSNFLVTYTVINTGIVERKTSLNGTFTASKGSMTVTPNLLTYDGNYFSRRGVNKLELKYTVQGGKLKLTDTDGSIVEFTKSK